MLFVLESIFCEGAKDSTWYAIKEDLCLLVLPARVIFGLFWQNTK